MRDDFGSLPIELRTAGLQASHCDLLPDGNGAVPTQPNFFDAVDALSQTRSVHKIHNRFHRPRSPTFRVEKWPRQVTPHVSHWIFRRFANDTAPHRRREGHGRIIILRRVEVAITNNAGGTLGTGLADDLRGTAQRCKNRPSPLGLRADLMREAIIEVVGETGQRSCLGTTRPIEEWVVLRMEVDGTDMHHHIVLAQDHIEEQETDAAEKVLLALIQLVELAWNVLEEKHDTDVVRTVVTSEGVTNVPNGAGPALVLRDEVVGRFLPVTEGDELPPIEMGGGLAHQGNDGGEVLLEAVGRNDEGDRLLILRGCVKSNQ